MSATTTRTNAAYETTAIPRHTAATRASDFHDRVRRRRATTVAAAPARPLSATKIAARSIQADRRLSVQFAAPYGG